MFTIHLMSSGIDVWIPGLILLGGFVGVISGLFGVGGGFLLTPCLVILFKLRYPMAVGSDLTQIFIVCSYAAFRHSRNRNVDMRLGVLMGIGAVTGTCVGKHFMDSLGNMGTFVLNGRTLDINTNVLHCLFITLLVIVGVSVWRESRKPSESEEVSTGLARMLRGLHLPPQISFPRSDIRSMSMWLPLFLSFLVGILTGLLGVGGGFVNFPLLVYVLGVPTLVAIGTSAFQILFASGFGAFAYFRSGQVELAVVGCLLAGSLLGSHFGVHLAQRLSGRNLRRYFSLVVALGALMIIGEMVHKILIADPTEIADSTVIEAPATPLE
ncbi:sulfite exporter TauE/SafE family protein [Candidatus Hydrogenedentota bacterium]